MSDSRPQSASQERPFRPGCGCPGHHFPGVKHVAACCEKPHIDQRQAASTEEGQSV